MPDEASSAAPPAAIFSIEGWRIDASTHRLSRDGRTIKLEPRTMAVLVYLANRPGQAVPREELEREIWRGLVVGYDALSNTIAKLRKAFGDDAKRPRVIETIPKVGYRLISAVGVPTPAAADEHPAENPGLERKLTAILCADVAGYSRLSGQDEDGTHRMLRAGLDAIAAAVERYHGTVVNYAGDAVLADFPTVSVAVACAVTVQNELEARHRDVTDARKVQFRIGVNLGEVIVDRDDIYGEGVNVAARLEGLAEPGGVCVSGAVFDSIGHHLPVEFEFLGEQTVKNISKPVRAYRVGARPGAKLPPPAAGSREKARPKRHGAVLIAAAVAVLLTGGAALWWQSRVVEPRTQSTIKVSPGMPSVAVLPFVNLTDQLAHEHFADGLTDDLITALSKLSGLFVIARHSMFAYKDRAVTVPQVADELGVRYVVEGSVRGTGERTRINVQLVDATTGGQLWGERYDDDETDVFTFQDRVVGNIVAALSVELSGTEKARLFRRPTDNLEAYDYYLRAERRRLFGDAGDAFGTRLGWAIALYQDAIELDPEFADAHAGLAETAFGVWRWDSTDVMSSDVARKLAYESAGKTLALDPDNPRAYGVLAMLQVTDGRHELALESARQAVALDPNHAIAYRNLAVILTYSGRHAEALQAMDTSFRLDPNPSLSAHVQLAEVLFFNRRYEQALTHLEIARDAGLDYEETLAIVYAELGRIEEAKAEVEKLYEGVPFANLAYYRALYGHHKRPEDLEHRIEALRKAGVPERAYGYDVEVADRIGGPALDALTFGHTWVGHDATGAPFIQHFAADGRVAFKGRASLLSGTAEIKEDLLCIEFPGSFLGREDCGYVYRLPENTPATADEFVRIALGDVYYFSVE